MGGAPGVRHCVGALAGEAATNVRSGRAGVPLVVHSATPDAAALGPARPGAVAPREAPTTLRQCLLLVGSSSTDAQHAEEAELALQLLRGVLALNGGDHDRNGSAAVDGALRPRVQTAHGLHPLRQSKAEVLEDLLLRERDVNAPEDDVDRRAAEGRRRQVNVTKRGGFGGEGRLERCSIPTAQRKAPRDRCQGV